MPDGYTGAFSIQVHGATSPVLGQNGQGLCRVRLRFEHAYIGDLQISLTAPNGQTVILVGPVGFFNPTNFSEWNISFVPCSKPANPDLGFGPAWSNLQGWGAFGNYTGTYYPFDGCLEDFNGSAVNGEWTLKVEDLQTGDTGTFLGYELVFCNPSGIECTNCAANAGFLLQNDVLACAGDSSLKLNIPPVYFDPQKRPPPASYDYQYVISGPGNIILDYDRTPDLRAYPPGAYTVCGLSYYKQHLPLLPSPNGTLTYNDLGIRLNAATPPFCGQMTNRCVGVYIKPPPRDTLLEQVLCAPDCILFLGEQYCATGVYTRTLKNVFGCPYQATLKLTVHTPTARTVFDTLCAGQCSELPGFANACTTGTYIDTLQNFWGCDSVVTLHLFVQNASLPQPVFAAVDSSVCLGDTLHAQITTIPGAAFYRWSDSFSSPATFVQTDTTVSIPWRAATGSTLCVSAANGCIESPPACRYFTTSFLPPPAIILGPDTVCSASVSHFRVDALAGWRDCVWEVEGGTIRGQKNAFEVDVLWKAQAKTARLCATLKNECGAALPGCRTLVVDSVPTLQSLDGDTLVCARNGLLFEYTVGAAGDVDNFQWQVTGDGQLATGEGKQTAQVAWSAPGGKLCVAAGGHCGTSARRCIEVTAFEPASALAGLDADTCGQTLPIAAAASLGLGEWALSGGPPGSTPLLQFQKNVAQNAVTVDAPGTYRAIWTVTNGACIDRDTQQLQFYGVPTTEAYHFDCDAIFENYQVALVLKGGALPYAVDGKNVSGDLFTSSFLPNDTPFRFNITDSNGCAAKPVEGLYACPCFSKAGQMDTTSLLVCGSDSTVAQKPTGAKLDPNDVGIFVLHTASTDTLGLVLAKSKTGVFRFQAGMVPQQSYYISYVVGNALDGLPDFAHPCLSVAKGQPIRFYQQPEAIAGRDANTCGLSASLQAIGTNGTGSWSLVDGPLNGKVSFVNGSTSAQNECTVDQFGTYRLAWSASNGVCTTIDTLQLGFFETPQTGPIHFICDSVGEHYSLSCSISGGSPPFKVNDIPLASGVFNAGWMAQGSAYDFQVSDANHCTAPSLAGTYTCACLTDAGNMDTTRLAVCAGDVVQARLPQNRYLDPNDAAAFVLHTAGTAHLGTVLAENESGRFEFLPDRMAYDSTYYISYVAGNAQDGVPDPSLPCFSVAKGQAVVFSQKPQLSAGVDKDTCGLSLSLSATLDKGLGTWSSDNSALVFKQDVHAANNAIAATQPGAYQVFWAATNGACTVSDTLNLRFFPSLQTSPAVLACDSVAEHFWVSFELKGGTPPFVVNGVVISGNTFVSKPLDAGSAYNYQALDANGCAAEELAGTHTCPCITETGLMDTDTLKACAGDSVLARLLKKPSLDPNDAGIYVLHTSSKDTLGDILAYNDSGTFGFLPGLLYNHTYYISYFAGNTLQGLPDWHHPCAQVSKGQPLIFLPKPAADAGLDRDTCGLSLRLHPKAGYGLGTWSAATKPGEGTLSFPNTQPNSVIADKPGQYTAVWTVANAACAVRDTTTLRFFPTPQAGIPDFFCDNVNEHYTVLYAVRGGTAPYWVNGIPISGNDFTSSLFDNGATFSFQVTDANGCGAAPLTGAHTCSCSTNAGVMQDTTLLALCEADTIQLKVPANAYLDPNDLGMFVLHTGTGKALGKIWAQNTSGRFAFQNGMSHDSTYYLSFVVANARNGLSDLNDVCLSVSKGRPLRFLPPPEAGFLLRGVRCFGEKNGVISVAVQKGTPPVLVALNEQPFSERTIFGALPPGTYQIHTLDATGCEWASDSLLLEEPPKLEVSLEKQLTVNQGDTLLVEAKTNYPLAAIDTFVWRPLLDALAVGAPWQRIAPLHTFMLSVSVADTNGCTARDQVLVQVQKKRRIFVPNTVTLQPGENTNLTVFGGPEIQEIERFELFDRWGNLWYQRSNFPPGSPDLAWQKKFQQKKITPRVFIYRTTIRWKDGEKDIFYGDIFLIN